MPDLPDSLRLGASCFSRPTRVRSRIDEARSAFTEARFLDAAGLAEAVGTSQGYALAARSLAVHGYYVATEEDRAGFFERAMGLAEEAVRADSTNPEAYFQSAHAVGRYAQTVGTITALRRGFAGKIRDLLEAALALYPDFTEAHVALGGWHTEARELLSKALELPVWDASEEFLQQDIVEALAALEGE